MAEIQDIKEQVEQKLQKQQANKEFKDVGRVALTRKEKSAYKLITGSVLSNLETDGVMAYNMVKKENVWPEINIQSERDRGVTSGGAYLKVKIRESVPTRPKDSQDMRATYVLFLEQLQKDLNDCFNVEQIAIIRDKYRNLPMDKVIGYFIKPEFLNADEETKNKIEDTLKKNVHFRVAMLYGSSRLVSKIVNEVFSSRFENTFFNKSDAARLIWHEAKDKEPISEERSKELITIVQEQKRRFVSANNESLEEYKNLSHKDLIYHMETKWSIHTENKKRYKADPESFRKWVTEYFERRVRNEEARYDEKIKNSQPKDNDWSWFESPKSKNESEKPKQTAINTKAPLAYIKRTGGYKIDNITPNEIVERFGFNAVNYGVYVDDAWSKQHTKHFLGAICDMAEVLNIDIRQFNNLGKLSIAFGAKGRKGHAATYFPQTKDINLTRGNGDGSVAHEWGHYFDNVLIELDRKIATSSFASKGQMPDYEINLLFKELMDFFKKGNTLYTPKVPMRFYPKKSDQVPSYSKYVNHGWSGRTVEIKNTIEETLQELDQFAIVDKNIYLTQLRVFGFVIDKFGLEYYDIPLKLKTSYFYHKSAYGAFSYCYPLPNDRFDIGVLARSNYWTSEVELFARAWETVVLKKLLDVERVSSYLVDSIPLEDIISENYNAPYPSGKELQYIETLIDQIITAVKKKFNIGDFIAPSQVKEDEYLDLTKTGKVEIGMDVDDGEKVDFVGEDAEAIETLELLIAIGGTDKEISEWKEKINTLKK